MFEKIPNNIKLVGYAVIFFIILNIVMLALPSILPSSNAGLGGGVNFLEWNLIFPLTIILIILFGRNVVAYWMEQSMNRKKVPLTEETLPNEYSLLGRIAALGIAGAICFVYISYEDFAGPYPQPPIIGIYLILLMIVSFGVAFLVGPYLGKIIGPFIEPFNNKISRKGKV